MILYVVTKHMDYYPCGGRADWFKVTSSLKEAQEVLNQNSGDDWGTIIELRQTAGNEWIFEEIKTKDYSK